VSMKETDGVTFESSDPRAWAMMEILRPAAEWRFHPEYQNQILSTMNLVSRLRRAEDGPKVDEQVEHQLLMEVATHMVALDKSPLSDERLQQIGASAADFAEIYFRLNEYCPGELDAIREEISRSFIQEENLDVGEVVNHLFVNFMRVKKKTSCASLD
jgi:hypothetical protein